MRFSSEADPVAEMISDFLNYPGGVPETRVLEAENLSELKNEEAVDTSRVKAPSENVRLAVEMLLAADVDSPEYKANLEIAKGYISKEIATS